MFWECRQPSEQGDRWSSVYSSHALVALSWHALDSALTTVSADNGCD